MSLLHHRNGRKSLSLAGNTLPSSSNVRETSLSNGIRAEAARNGAASDSSSDRVMPLARWLAADSLMSLCTMACADFHEIYGLSHLLLVAHAERWPLGWAMSPWDERWRFVDEWFAKRAQNPASAQTEDGPPCPVGSARLPQIDPALQQAGFHAGASVETGRSTSYCVFWSRDGSAQSPQNRVNRGVDEDDLILDGTLWNQLQLVLGNMARMEYLRELSYIDSITGVFNRRYFNLRLTEETSRSRRSGRPLSLLVFDIDHFKDLNDSMGHQAGDAILHSVAEYVRWTVRSTDLLCRLSGDEFCILMPDTDTEDCRQLGERLQISMCQRRFRPGSGFDAVPVQISIGGAVFPLHAPDTVAILWCADKALLSAKQQGRNCFLLYDPSMGNIGSVK